MVSHKASKKQDDGEDGLIFPLVPTEKCSFYSIVLKADRRMRTGMEQKVTKLVLACFRIMP